MTPNAFISSSLHLVLSLKQAVSPELVGLIAELAPNTKGGEINCLESDT